MEIRVNGKPRSVPAEVTLRQVLADLGLGDALVAVERNRQIIPRAEHSTTRVEDGDELEVVHFVGGG